MAAGKTPHTIDALRRCLPDSDIRSDLSFSQRIKKGFAKAVAGKDQIVIFRGASDLVAQHLAERTDAIADVFDAMTTDGPDRGGLPLEYVLEEIRKGAGTQFAPSLAKTFMQRICSRSIPLSPQAVRKS